MRAKNKPARRSKNKLPTYSKLKASLGQSQVLLLLFFLFLVPTSVILAQNATINESLPLEGLITSNSAYQETINLPINLTELIENLSDSEDTVFGENLTLPIANNTNSTENIPDLNMIENQTDDNPNITLPENTTINVTINENNSSQPGLNITDNITNTTEPPITDPINDTINQTENITEPEPPNITIPIEFPILFLEIDSPDRFTRGEIIPIKGIVTNRGLASSENVVLWLELPDYFELVSGNLEKDCGYLAPAAVCENEIEIRIPDNAELRNEEIEVKVSYED